MNWKWYIPLLVVVFAFAGMSHQKSVVDTNQEIFIEFLESDLDEVATEVVISGVISQLKLLGAKNVRISKLLSGKLKIQYYSTLDASEIKKNLDDNISEENKSKSGNDSFPSSKSENFSIAVVKIQKNIGLNKSATGTLIEVNRLQDIFLKPKLISGAFFNLLYIKEEISISDGIICSKEIEHFNNFFKTLPEIRAGPFT